MRDPPLDSRESPDRSAENRPAPTLQDQLDRWYKSRKDSGRFAQRPYPIYLLAAQGGGVYAAYHAARLLASLQDRCPSFAQHLFAVSGVSGGSVGLALFNALQRVAEGQDAANAAGACSLTPNTGSDRETLRFAVAQTLNSDLLSPLLGGLLFPDLLQRALPFPIYQFDRPRWLELAFEQALQSTFDKGPRWKDAPNYLARPFAEHGRADGLAPALLLNTTEVSTGSRCSWSMR